MELKKLYTIAEKEIIDIIDFKMKNKAIIGCIYDKNYNRIKLFAYKQF